MEELKTEEDTCQACDGTGELESPAENRGGEIVGPDTRPCPNCQFKNEDDGE